jgi:hypothetical protein
MPTCRMFRADLAAANMQVSRTVGESRREGKGREGKGIGYCMRMKTEMEINKGNSIPTVPLGVETSSQAVRCKQPARPAWAAFRFHQSGFLAAGPILLARQCFSLPDRSCFLFFPLASIGPLPCRLARTRPGTHGYYPARERRRGTMEEGLNEGQIKQQWRPRMGRRADGSKTTSEERGSRRFTFPSGSRVDPPF